jgi:hypothetical protein
MSARESLAGERGVAGREGRIQHIVRLVACLVSFTGVLPVSALCAEPNEELPDAKPKTQSRIFQAMRERAKAVRVSSENRPNPAVKMIAEPLMHFSDPEINILDGRLWAWSDGGRPQAVMKVEAHLWNGDVLPQVTWVHCFVSISPERIVAVWPNGPKLAASEPGLKLETFSKAPRPAESKSARLTQMKALARRFSAHQIDEAKKDLEMRLLPTPIYRYADQEIGVQDGAAFVFASSGTNPTLLLLVELFQPESGEPKWQYSLARMTVRAMTVQLDGQVVYEQAFAGFGGVVQPSWLAFPQKGLLPDEPEK